MQTSGRRRHRARLPCKDRLVTPGVFRIRRAMQIRRKGDLASTIRIDRALKLDESFALLADFGYASGHTVEQNRGPEAHLAAGFDEAQPCLRIDLIEE